MVYLGKLESQLRTLELASESMNFLTELRPANAAPRYSLESSQYDLALHHVDNPFQPTCGRHASMLDGLLELVRLIKEKAANRLALVISDGEIYLNLSGSANQIYLLEIATSNAAGGRGGGYGSRDVTKVYRFEFDKGAWRKSSEISDKGLLEGFVPPHYVSLLPLTLDDGSVVVVYGAIDPALISEYDQRFGSNIS